MYSHKKVQVRDKGMMVRLLPEQHTILNNYCNRSGRSKTVVIRAFIQALGKSPKEIEQLLDWRDKEDG